MAKDFICRCNNCMNILIDENPKEDAVMQELTGAELPMEKFIAEKEEPLEEDEYFWGCPKCETDEYLIDL